MKALTDWYNQFIVAGWYRSWSLIGGWLTSAAVFLPDLLQFVVDHWGAVSGTALPSFTAEQKAMVLGAYVTFVAPPLRAWQQEKMQEAATKQKLARLAAAISEEAKVEPS